VDDNNVVTETADTTKPTVTSATLNYNTGVLVVTFSETIDASATVTTAFHLNDVTGTDDVTLSAAPAAVDAVTLTFTLTEAQRVAAIAISGTAGGDGVAVVLDVDVLGITDMATNTNLVDDNNVVTETADTTKPTFVSAVFTTDTNLDVVFSETLNAVDYTKFTSTSFTVSSASIDGTDGTKVHVTISGLSAANQTSGVSGVAGLQLAAAAVTDKATNTNNLASNNAVSGDITAPTLVSAVFTDAALKVGETSLVTFTFSEAVTGFTNADLTIVNGGLTAVTDLGAGTIWTATFTPTDDIEDATNVITVAMTGVADAAGNAGLGTTDSSNYAIDTKEPVITYVSVSPAENVSTTRPTTITANATDANFLAAPWNVTVYKSDGTTVVAYPTLTLNAGVGYCNMSATWDATWGVGALTGTPVPAGNYIIRLTVIDALGQSTQNNTTVSVYQYAGYITSIRILYSNGTEASQIVIGQSYQWEITFYNIGPTAIPKIMLLCQIKNPSGEVVYLGTGGTYNWPAGSTFICTGSFSIDTSASVGTYTVEGNAWNGWVDVEGANHTMYANQISINIPVVSGSKNPATSPVITLTGTHWGAQTPVGWNVGNTVYTATFTHDGTQESIPAEVATVAAGSGATDVAGNAENGGASPAFIVDTEKPTPTVTTSPATIYEGALVITVTVTYSEAMPSRSSSTKQACNINDINAATIETRLSSIITMQRSLPRDICKKPIRTFANDPYPATLPTDDGTGWSNGVKSFVGSGFKLYIDNTIIG
ncbi:MAG: Ig-like domain-containing protein, partial [Thermoplasmatales archaeon]|nr:Ig-like domain-containing protein [Thermoplasmatales archaeon]